MESSLDSIQIGYITFPITNFNTALCQQILEGNYALSAPSIVVGSMQYSIVPQTVDVSSEAVSVTANYQGTPIPTGQLCLQVLEEGGLNISDLQPITVGGVEFSFTQFGEPVCQNLALGNYAINPPVITSGGNTYLAGAQSVSITQNETAKATISYSDQQFIVKITTSGTYQIDQGDYSGDYQSQIAFVFQNNSSETIQNGWSVEMSIPGVVATTGAYNMNTPTVNAGVVSFTSLTGSGNSWETLNPGGSVSMGMAMISTGNNFQPTSVTLFPATTGTPEGFPCGILYNSES
jgi:hypothetical protein